MTNSNSNSDVLATVSATIDSFLALPCYGLLADLKTDEIILKSFIPSKDNTSVLSGTQDTFRSLDLSQFVFTLPDPLPMPDPNAFDDTAKGFKEYKTAISEFEITGKVYNDSIKSLAAKLLHHDVKRKHDKLLRVCQFVSNHDASMFVHQEELDLHELPLTVRTKILDIYKASFKANPSLEFTGGLHKIDLTNFEDNKIRTNPNPITVPCSLDSVDGINSIIAVKNTAPSASYGFMSKEILGSVLESIRQDCNGKTLLKVITRLDTHSGGSKNSTTILANLRMLLGFVPTKGKAKTAA